MKEQKGDLALSVRRVSALSVLGLPPVRAVLRTAVSCLCENRREAGAFQREPRSLLGTWLTYRASFAHEGLVRVLSCHFQKSGLTGGGVSSELPKSDERNVDKRLANASTIFRKVFKSPWGCRTPVHESFQEGWSCDQPTANQDGFQGQHHATA